MMKPETTVMGVDAPPARLTPYGVRLALLLGGGAVMLLALIADLLLLAIFHFGLGRCYGLFCLL